MEPVFRAIVRPRAHGLHVVHLDVPHRQREHQPDPQRPAETLEKLPRARRPVPVAALPPPPPPPPPRRRACSPSRASPRSRTRARTPRCRTACSTSASPARRRTPARGDPRRARRGSTSPPPPAAAGSFGGRRTSDGPTPRGSNPRSDPTPPRKNRSAMHVPLWSSRAAAPSGTSAPSFPPRCHVTPSANRLNALTSASCLKKRVAFRSNPIPASSLRRRHSAPVVGRTALSRASPPMEYDSDDFSECPS